MKKLLRERKFRVIYKFRLFGLSKVFSKIGLADIEKLLDVYVGYKKSSKYIRAYFLKKNIVKIGYNYNKKIKEKLLFKDVNGNVNLSGFIYPIVKPCTSYHFEFKRSY